MVKNIKAEMGEECEVDVLVLHETLLKLPAEKYLLLHQRMKEHVDGYPYWTVCSVNADGRKVK